ncbi:MAG: hypothetical protein COV52_09795 [Gammaproteobacteria bacterium CG11_big_fil_rev_8_21_14_0_20_46_22]|nr:MAG: hypothetical protein COV52_09795 [Gammaproteobacteria bacterium CG11_big_fil_rev_8_21_14_0_20_46_22]
MSKKSLINSNLESRDSRIFARVPKALKKKLQTSSKKSGRNLTAELIVRLAHSLEEHEFIECIPEWINE